MHYCDRVVILRPTELLRRVPDTVLRFAAAGLLTLLVDAGTLWFLYSVAGRPLWLATTVAYWFAFVVNFIAHKYFTFGARTGGPGQLVRYSMLVGLNFLATLGIVTGLAELGLPALGAKFVAVVLLQAVNYVAYQRWVFRD